MVLQPASAPWTARVIAGPWEGDAAFSFPSHIEALSSHFLCKGALRSSLHGSPLSKGHSAFLFREQKRRNSAAIWGPRNCVASVKNKDALTTSTEIFELARRKFLSIYLHAREGQLPDGIFDRVTSTRKNLSEECDLSPGLFHSGHKLPHFQAATKCKDAYSPRSLLLNLKKVCTNAYQSGVRTIEATQLAPLLPYSGPLLAVIGFTLIFGILVGRWIGKTSTQSVRLLNAGVPQVLASRESKASTGISVFLEGDMKKKESVEWVNMVLGKLWKVYRLGLESWLVGLLQPLIDNLQKPDYVSRVQIKRFDLGDEPISIRSVERRTSRRVNDLQYHIGLRYTGGARMLLLLTLKAAFIPITIPVGVRELDVDGELWVKLRLVPSEPWVGTATWAFVSLPKIKLDLSPFRLFNLMAIPFLSIFLTKLLTQDLPRLFVRPNKNVIDFLQGRVVGPVPKDFKVATTERNTGFTGELSVTLVDARKLRRAPLGKTDPYVILILGDQVIRSKKNSQTSVFGPPGSPIWNQDFQLLVVDPKTQRLAVRVRDFIGLTAVTVGVGEVDLISLRDTVPVDKVVRLKGGWGPFRKSAGEILLRLTYTAYVDDEEEDASLSFPNDQATVADGIADAVPSVQEVLDKVVKAVQIENPAMNQAITSLSNLGLSTDEPLVPEGSEDEGKGGIIVNKLPAKKERTEELAPAVAEEAENFSGRTMLLWLGVLALLSILMAISLNFSNLMNP